MKILQNLGKISSGAVLVSTTVLGLSVAQHLTPVSRYTAPKVPPQPVVATDPQLSN